VTEEQAESHPQPEGQAEDSTAPTSPLTATTFESFAASWVPPWAREVPELQIEPAADSPPPPPLPAATAAAETSASPEASVSPETPDAQETPVSQETPAAQEEPVSEEEKSVGRFAYGDADDLPDPDEFVPGMPDEQLRGAIEAIMLVVDNPVTSVVLAQVLEEPTTRVEAMLERMRAEYARPGSGIDLRQVAGGWRFYTRPDYASYVERFVLDGQQIRLTQAALETLAVIAYKQPVTRSKVSAIRGVNCDGVIKTLVTRGLIEECGTEESGAHLYRTTQLFLEKLGINSVEDLPSLAQYLPSDLDEIEAGAR
jgi:segregation and condensation protein B